MTIDRVNYLNIGLMILSCLIAFVLPFHLLIFSYVILGPLHYLTEITWLHQRQYFAPKKQDVRILILLSVFILAPTAFRFLFHFVEAKSLDTFSSGQNLYFYMALFNQIAKVMIFVVFAVAALILLVENTFKRIIGIVLIAGIGLLLRRGAIINVAFAVFVPTLIHVFIFTGAFILLGALKGKSLSGILSLVVFIACAASLLLFYTHPAGRLGDDVMNVYNAGFYRLNRQVFATFLHINEASNSQIYFSRPGILITRFIAYAYTYHYLNWFSKTSVIKWHVMPRNTIIKIICIWTASLIIYFTNFRTGFALLYFLSMLHVILEFPLNFQSFRDIGLEIKARITGKGVPVPAFSEWEGDRDYDDDEADDE